MKKVLIAYFSASGMTRTAAEKLAAVAGADLFEIKPETLYTITDLDWTNKQSRSTLEMQDVNCRPALAADELCMGGYDVVFVGFPIGQNRGASAVGAFSGCGGLSSTRGTLRFLCQKRWRSRCGPTDSLIWVQCFFRCPC